MIEQYVEMYDMSTYEGQLKAKNDMNDNVSRGWQIKQMTVTPDYGQYTSVYPKMYVLYERKTRKEPSIQ